MCFRDSHIGEQQSHRLGPHRGAAIGMQSELTGLDALFLAALFVIKLHLCLTLC